MPHFMQNIASSSVLTLLVSSSCLRIRFLTYAHKEAGFTATVAVVQPVRIVLSCLQGCSCDAAVIGGARQNGVKENAVRISEPPHPLPLFLSPAAHPICGSFVIPSAVSLDSVNALEVPVSGCA